MALETNVFVLVVIIGTLAAIVYSLRVLVQIERRVARMEMNIQRMVGKLVKGRKKKK